MTQGARIRSGCGLGGLVAVVAAAALALAPPAAGKGDDLPRRRLPDEFDYVDAPADEEASALLEKLVAKYDTPRECEKLLKLLREKRPYPSRVPDRLTLEHAGPDGKRREFTWLLPSRYAKGRSIGALVFLHGAVRQPPPGGGANEAQMFAPAVKDLGFAVLGPSTYEGVEWGSPACRDLVHHALTLLKQYVNVDEDRVYLAGDSDGGRGTYAILETMATSFAAAVPVIGAPGGVTRFANLRNVPLFAINGETDSIFDIAHVRQLVEGMKASGIDLVYKEIAGQGHDPRFFLTYQEEVREFLKAHPRIAHPAVVDWQVDPKRGDHDGGFPGDTFRWIRIDEAGSASSRGDFGDTPGGLINGSLPRVRAVREGNRIEVQTAGVKRYTVLLSDEALDLAKEVVIVTNGAESFRGLVVPEARAILEEARRFQDRRLVYANRVEVEVP